MFWKKLTEKEYKLALTERVYSLDNKQVMLFQVPIKKRNEEVIGYYVMGVSLDIFKTKFNQYKMMIDGDIQLINLDGVLNHSDNQFIGKLTKDPLYLEEISNLIMEIKEETHNATLKLNDGTREIENGSQVVVSAENVFKEIQLRIDKVVEGINQAVSVISDVNEDSQEIVENVDNISSIIETNAANTEEVAASSEEQFALIEQLTLLADTLSDMAEELNNLVKIFELS